MTERAVDECTVDERAVNGRAVNRRVVNARAGTGDVVRSLRGGHAAGSTP